MAIRPILLEPDSRLRQQAEPVPAGWPGLPGLVKDLLQTLAASGGIGLASPQIGEPWRVVVVDLSLGQRVPLVLVNPRLIAASGQVAIEEGCLSVPERRIRVPRHASITVEAGDTRGRLRRFQAEGLLAICIQHEIDHLDGRLILDAVPASAA